MLLIHSKKKPTTMKPIKTLLLILAVAAVATSEAHDITPASSTPSPPSPPSTTTSLPHSLALLVIFELFSFLVFAFVLSLSLFLFYQVARFSLIFVFVLDYN